MNRIQAEARVLEIVDRALAGQGVEDSQAELKRDWPTDIPRAARLIAAHLNASHGEPVLWIFGVDEKAATLYERTPTELANWWPQIQGCFDQVPPELLMDLEVPTGRGSVAALLIASDSAPYVVKNPNSGQIQREVPWREGRSTRSARRSDLIRMLGPRTSLPTFEILEAEVHVRPSGRTRYDDTDLRGVLEPDDDGTYVVSVYLKIFIEPTGAGVVVVPTHRTQVSVQFGAAGKITLHDVLLRAHDADARPIEDSDPAWMTASTPSRVVIAHPGTYYVNESTVRTADSWPVGGSASIEVRAMPVGASSPATAATPMPERRELDQRMKELERWAFSLPGLDL